MNNQWGSSPPLPNWMPQQLSPEELKYQFISNQIVFLSNQIAAIGHLNPTLSTELLKAYLDLNKALINSDLKPTPLPKENSNQ